jgi:8-oxo-dGTP diphosphatase
VTPTVRAAGGVVWRDSPVGVEVVVVHRPKYDDVTFPKGKAEGAETDEECARREVREETGLACRLGTDLGRVEYVDGLGRPKVVRYWAMTVVEAGPPPGDEVDDVRWLAPAAASAALSYDRDREVLETFIRLRGGAGDAGAGHRLPS